MSGKAESVKLALDSADPVAELERRGWSFTGAGRGLRWYRTMPYRPESKGRSFVTDDPALVTPFYHDGYNSYRPVLEHLQADAVLLDWDIAISFEDRQRFAQHIADDPDRVQIAPYRLYPGPKHCDIPDGESRWAAFTAEAIAARLPAGHPGRAPAQREDPHIREGEPYAATFGFGCAYLPIAIVREFLAGAGAAKVTDGLFSAWHYHRFGEVPVHWDVRPVHLNYAPG